jgi:hypothetical protein
LKATDEKKQDPDPNPDPNPNPDPETKVSGTYPRIRIRTKMSRIHNTDFLRAYSYGVKKEKKIAEVEQGKKTKIKKFYGIGTGALNRSTGKRSTCYLTNQSST